MDDSTVKVSPPFERGIVNIPYSEFFKHDKDSMSALSYGIEYLLKTEKEYEKQMNRMELSEEIINGLTTGAYVLTSCSRTDEGFGRSEIIAHFAMKPGIFGAPKLKSNALAIRKVVFNDPATIVFWEDGDKTVVKCGENDIFDPEKGLAMCIAKKALGNKGKYYDIFKKWLPEEEPAVSDAFTPLTEAVNKIKDSFGKAGVEIKKILGENTESIKYERNKTQHQSEVGAVSAVKAAKRLGVSASTVRRWYAKGKLKGMTIKGHIYICLNDPAFSKDK